MTSNVAILAGEFAKPLEEEEDDFDAAFDALAQVRLIYLVFIWNVLYQNRFQIDLKAHTKIEWNIDLFVGVVDNIWGSNEQKNIMN